MGTSAVIIDPTTGERVPPPGSIQIDPATGERIAAPNPPAASTPQQPGFFGSFAGASGLSTLGHAIAHPIDTAMGIPSAVKSAAVNEYQQLKDIAAQDKGGLPNLQQRRQIVAAIPVVGPALQHAQQQYDSGNGAGAAGTIAGTVAGLAGPEAVRYVPGVVGRGMEATGGYLEDSGANAMNKTVGVYKGDFNRGANPGRGYLAAGGTPQWSMQGLADKSKDLLNSTGQEIQNVIKNSPAAQQKIPVNDVVQALSVPLKNLHDLETGPGGMGNTAPLTQYAQGFKDTIQQGLKNGGFTPQDVFQLKKKIANNTSWSDPTQLNIKAVRQQQVGALGSVLVNHLPELDQLNQDYQDLLKFNDRAQYRAETGSTPLSNGLAKNMAKTAGAFVGERVGGPVGAVVGSEAAGVPYSTPVRSTGAYLRNKAGLTLGNVGGALSSTPLIPAGAGLGGKAIANPGTNGVQNQVPQSQSENNPANVGHNSLAGSNPTTGPALWQQNGANNLSAHLAKDSSSGLTPADVNSLANSSQGRQMLINAGDLKPGTKAMSNLAQQVKAFLKK